MGQITCSCAVFKRELYCAVLCCPVLYCSTFYDKEVKLQIGLEADFNTYFSSELDCLSFSLKPWVSFCLIRPTSHQGVTPHFICKSFGNTDISTNISLFLTPTQVMSWSAEVFLVDFLVPVIMIKFCGKRRGAVLVMLKCLMMMVLAEWQMATYYQWFSRAPQAWNIILVSWQRSVKQITFLY